MKRGRCIKKGKKEEREEMKRDIKKRRERSYARGTCERKGSESVNAEGWNIRKKRRQQERKRVGKKG